MTKAFTGLWRFQDGDETTVIRLHPNGKLTAHAHVNAGGAADAVLSAAQHDMGDIKGEWWVESGDFCIRFTGVENSIWNIWVRAVDAVFVGNFGKLLRYKVTLGEDKIILEPRSADQEVIELRHVQSEK